MLQTIGEKVLLEQIENTEEKVGNFYIPETAKKPGFYATVRAVGKDVKEPIKVGDKVVYNRAKTVKVVVDKIDYLVTYASEIIAVIEE